MSAPAAESRSPKVVVIGAGPAGSMAALLAARSGLEVHVLERKRFPRNKVCGGCLSALAVRVLHQVFGSDADVPGVATQRIEFVRKSRRKSVVSKPHTTRLVARRNFDAWLAQQAEEAGARMHWETAATLDRTGDRWVVRAGKEEIAPRFVLLAWGLQRRLEALGIPAPPARRPMAGLQWTTQSAPGLPDTGEVQMHFLRRGYVGLAGTAAGEVNLAIAVDDPGGAGGSLLEGLRESNRDAPIWRLLDSSPSLTETSGAAGFPFRPARVATDNMLLLGDAAGYEEPYSGEGIGLALLSATLAIHAVTSGSDAARTYTTLMQRQRDPLLDRCRRYGRLLRCGWLNRLDAVIPVLPSLLATRLVKRVHAR